MKYNVKITPKRHPRDPDKVVEWHWRATLDEETCTNELFEDCDRRAKLGSSSPYNYGKTKTVEEAKANAQKYVDYVTDEYKRMQQQRRDEEQNSYSIDVEL